MTAPRTRFVSGSRSAAAVEVDARRAWLTALGLWREHAARTLAGEAIDLFDAAELRRQVERLKSPFPLGHASATEVAGAAIRLARAFIAAARPEDKAAIARLLGQAAAFLEAQLVAQGHALAQASRRWAGDKD